MVGGSDCVDAGLWERFLAYLVDSLLVSTVVYGPVLLFFGASDPVKVASLIIENEAFFQVVPMVLNVSYFASFDASKWHATPGKRLMRIQVCRPDGTPLGIGGALGRAFARTLIINLCGIAVFSVCSADRRGWWNQAANARVVKAREARSPAIDPDVFK